MPDRDDRPPPELIEAAEALISLVATTHPDDLVGYVVVHTLPECPGRPLVYDGGADASEAQRRANTIVDGHDDQDGELGTVVVAELLRWSER